jgi:hypothetical protein
METIHKSIIEESFISEINSQIEKISYDKSMWLFEKDNPKIFNLIRSYLSEHELLKKHIFTDTYIVVRCVKKSDKHRQYESHFDNYKETFVIPLLIPEKQPKGELMAWFNARRYPKSFLEHFLTKAFFQNRLFRYLMKRYLLKYFKLLKMLPGDVASFDGFTTLHFNYPVSNERRSILIHNEKAFSNNIFSHVIDELSRWNVKYNK